MQLNQEQIETLHWVREQYVEEEYGTLHMNGWRLLGAGYYGAVYTHRELPFVVKVGRKADDGWPEFARWSRAHPEFWDKGILPVYYLHRDREYHYVAAIKRLACVEDWDVASAHHVGFTLRDEYRNIAKTIGEYMGRCSIAPMDRVPSFAPVLGAVRLLASHFEGTVDLDLHMENVMIDPDTGRLVITDPFGTSSVSTRDEEDDDGHPDGTAVPYPVREGASGSVLGCEHIPLGCGLRKEPDNRVDFLLLQLLDPGPPPRHVQELLRSRTGTLQAARGEGQNPII